MAPTGRQTREGITLTATLTAPAPAADVAASLDVAYVRVSSDRAGAGLGVGSQLEAITRTAAGMGVDVESLHVITDNDVSAYDRRKPRPGYTELMELIWEGRCRRLFIWHNDRLHRQNRELEPFIDAVELHAVEIQTVVSGALDLSTPVGRLAARMVGAQAQFESEIKAERLKLMHERKGNAGQFHGGRRRFGYTPDMKETKPEEAEAIRDACARLLDGESIASITRRWNAAGLRTATRKEFRSNNVAKLLRGRHLIAVRRHNGTETPAGWPPILDVATHNAVVRLLSDPARRTTPERTGGRVYALSGVLRCDVCGNGMYGRPTPLKSGPAYVCRNGNHTQAPVEAVEGTVRDAVITLLSRVNAAGVFVPVEDRDAADARQAERVALEARRDVELPEAVADGDLTPAQVKTATAKIDRRLAELTATDNADADARRRPQRVLAGLTGMPYDETAAVFDALPVDRQRAVIGVLGVPSLRRSARKGAGNKWDPRRVVFTWADSGTVA